MTPKNKVLEHKVVILQKFFTKYTGHQSKQGKQGHT